MSRTSYRSRYFLYLFRAWSDQIDGDTTVRHVTANLQILRLAKWRRIANSNTFPAKPPPPFGEPETAARRLVSPPGGANTHWN